MAKGIVGGKRIAIEYADDVCFIGGVAVWGEGRGEVVYNQDRTFTIRERISPKEDPSYEKTVWSGTVTTPKGVQVTII